LMMTNELKESSTWQCVHLRCAISNPFKISRYNPQLGAQKQMPSTNYLII